MSIETNLIYRGDCYSVLKRYFPNGNNQHGIDLIYIDPPFSFDPKYARLWYDKETLSMFEELSKGDVKHYIAWMSKRLEQCHRVLKNTGSIYLHCDWKFGHYLKVEMDNIFDRKNFRNEVIWAYQTGGRAKSHFSRKHDTIFFYTKSDRYNFYPNAIKLKRELTSHLRKGVDEQGRRYGEITNKKTGRVYRYYEDEGKIPSDVWIDINVPHQLDQERIGYPTQKPETLLERIILASSKKEDIILDSMCGCGTTIAVAHKLERKWVGIDISSQACEEMKKRMQKLEDIVEVEVRGLPLTINDLKKLNPFEFQDYICEMTNSQKTKLPDKGIDGYHLGEIPIQIKQQERVGRKVVDEFETALRRKGKDKGYIIGLSFTKNTYEEAARAKDDELNISLIRVDELIKKDYELKNQ